MAYSILKNRGRNKAKNGCCMCLTFLVRFYVQEAQERFLTFWACFVCPGGPGTLPAASWKPQASFSPNMSPRGGTGTRIGYIFVHFPDGPKAHEPQAHVP